MITLEDKIKNIFPVDNILLLKIDLLPSKKVVLTIGKKDGITLDDCEKISKIIHPIIGDDYYLQVQSSGIGWNIDINSDSSFIFLDQTVKITYSKDGKTKTEKGILKSIEENCIIIETKNKKIKIDKNNIIKLKTDL